MSPKVIISLLLAALPAAAVVSCSLAVDLDPLSAGCAADEQLCPPKPGEEPACVKISPEYGCGRENCVVCSPPNAQAYCLPGEQCGVASCNGFWEDCNLDPVDGCEKDLSSDPQNCKSCGLACDLANANAGCSSRTCVIISCKNGFDDCDGVDDNGCEVPLNIFTDCGACGNRCAATEDCLPGGGTWSCVAR